jgi:hypothetical protein
MSGKQPKKRATGSEKSQDRPTHTSLTALNETVTSMEQQQSSDIRKADNDELNIDTLANINNGDNIANIDNIDNIDRDQQPPFVKALTTPFAQPIIVKQHAATLCRLQEQEREIQRQQQQIHDLEYEAHLKGAHHHNLLQGAQISSRPSSVSPSTRGPTPQCQLNAQEMDIIQQEQEIASLILSLESKKSEYAQMKRTVSPDPRLPIKTPGPHRLQPRPDRPEDIAFKQKLREQDMQNKLLKLPRLTLLIHNKTRLSTSLNLLPRSCLTTTSISTPTTSLTLLSSLALTLNGMIGTCNGERISKLNDGSPPSSILQDLAQSDLITR